MVRWDGTGTARDDLPLGIDDHHRLQRLDPIGCRNGIVSVNPPLQGGRRWLPDRLYEGVQIGGTISGVHIDREGCGPGHLRRLHHLGQLPTPLCTGRTGRCHKVQDDRVPTLSSEMKRSSTQEGQGKVRCVGRQGAGRIPGTGRLICGTAGGSRS